MDASYVKPENQRAISPIISRGDGINTDVDFVEVHSKDYTKMQQKT